MKFIVPALAALALASMATVSIAAEAKQCKAGKVFNPDTGKCETIRGS